MLLIFNLKTSFYGNLIVFQPFDSATKPGLLSVLFCVGFLWISSLTTALLPLAPFLEGDFVDKALLPSNPFFENVAVEFEAAKTFLKKLRIYDSNITAANFFTADFADSWYDLQMIATRDTNHPEYVTASRWIG